MRLELNANRINFLGEFTDKGLENEFIKKYMLKSAGYLRTMAIIFGVLNTLFLIPDYIINYENKEIVYSILAGRFIFLALIIAFIIASGRIKKHNYLIIWITVIEMVEVILFLFVYFEYAKPDFLIQAFGTILIIIAYFIIIPNRWINVVSICFIHIIGFILISAKHSKNIETSDFVPGIVYIVILFLCCVYTSLRNNINERKQYVNSKELIRLSITDPLTGAYNRLKIDDEMEKWVEYSKRFSLPLSITIIDFDNFKDINDTYGHLAGDKVIVETANIIKNQIRKIDIFARWGGEEFMLILPNTNNINAKELSNRIRKEIEEHVFINGVRITCSVGVSQLTRDDDVVSLIEKADLALYAAKQDGKNKVEVN